MAGTGLGILRHWYPKPLDFALAMGRLRQGKSEQPDLGFVETMSDSHKPPSKKNLARLAAIAKGLGIQSRLPD